MDTIKLNTLDTRITGQRKDQSPDVRIKNMSYALSFGLTWRVPEGGNKEKASKRFTDRVELYSQDFIEVWSKACRERQFLGLSGAVEKFINRISTYDTVDETMPLYRAQQQNAKNSFTFVRILKSTEQQPIYGERVGRYPLRHCR